MLFYLTSHALLFPISESISLCLCTLFNFHLRYWFTIAPLQYLALEVGSTLFKPIGFTQLFIYNFFKNDWTLTIYGKLIFHLFNIYNMGLWEFARRLLSQSRLISFPPANKMFQFAGFFLF